MLTFDKSKHMELLFGQEEVVTETLMEFIIEDVFDIVTDVEDDVEDPDIIYEDYRSVGTSVQAILPALFFIVRWCLPVSTEVKCLAHPNYDTKMGTIPGYYRFLNLLRLF